jgi:uncharacterized protein YbjT (DUF2867 family)
MRILILGAAGFIGANLARAARTRGVEVVALCRSGQMADFDGSCHTWAFGQTIPARALDGVNVVFHLAHDFQGVEGADLTRRATLACIEQARAAGIPRQFFFSSYSAGPHATSLYGRTKFAIEQALAGAMDVTIVRPGLVLGNGGIYGRIRHWARRLPILPLPDGGAGVVPVIEIGRLCHGCLDWAARVEAPIELNLFEARLKSLRQLVLDAAAEVGRAPLILPVPARLVSFGLRLAGWLRLPMPVNVDNLEGFLANQSAGHRATTMEDSP